MLLRKLLISLCLVWFIVPLIADAGPLRDKIKRKTSQSQQSAPASATQPTPTQSPKRTMLTSDGYCRVSPDSEPYFALKGLSLNLSRQGFFDLASAAGGKFDKPVIASSREYWYGEGGNSSSVGFAYSREYPPIVEGGYVRSTKREKGNSANSGRYQGGAIFEFDGDFTIAGLPVLDARYFTDYRYENTGKVIETKCSTTITVILKASTSADTCKIKDALDKKYGALDEAKNWGSRPDCKVTYKGGGENYSESLALFAAGINDPTYGFAQRFQLRLEGAFKTQPAVNADLDLDDL